MKNSKFAVFIRLFFIATLLVFAMISLCACGDQEAASNNENADDGGYTVTFVLNNGEDNVVWQKGDDVPAPTKENCEFLYWCSDEKLSLKADLDFANLTLEQNTILYAKWQELIDLEGVVFEDATCVYDGEAHSLKVDETSLPDGATVAYDSENAFVNAGEYAVCATIKADGYKDLVLSATLKIEKAKLVGITFPKVEVVWDGNKHNASVVYEGGELPSEVKVAYDGNGQAEVGNHTVTAKFETGGNYESVADMTTSLVIKEKYFSVTFDDGISDKVIRQVAHGQTLSNIPNPTAKVGYSACWSANNFENILADVDVEAEYTPLEYTISFISGGSVAATKKYDIENSVDFDAISRQHYDFEGWYANENCTGESTVGIAVGNYGDKSFYAKWSAVEYFVTYHTNGGTNAESNANCDGKYKYTVESDSLLLAAPQKSDYIFGGWYADEDFEGEPVATLVKGASGNIDLYAKWASREYEITYDYRGGETCDNPTKYTVDTNDFTLVAPQKSGYDFVGWFDENGDKIVTVRKGSRGNLALHAVWTATVYTITFDSTGGSEASKIEYTVEDKTVALPQSERTGYTFAGWFGDNEKKYETVSGDMQKNISLKAEWSVVSYTITYDLGGGSEANNPTSYTIEEEITLLDAAKDGYAFDGWYYGSGKKIEVIAKGSSGNLALHAVWTATAYTITLDAKNGSYATTLTYTIENESVALPQPERTGYTFAGWFDKNEKKYETVSGDMQKNISLTAKWSAVSYAITYDLGGGSQVANPTSYTIENEITLLDAAKDGYTFDGWFNGENKVEKIEKGSYGNLTLTAHWTQNIPASDFFVDNGVIKTYNGTGLTITVHSIEAGQTVTSVEASAFDSVRESVTQIVVEEGVQSVERGTFDGMTNLKTLVLPSTISTLYRGMLKDCASLESLTIPFASFVTAQSINDVATNENAALSATAYDGSSQGYAVGFTYLFGKPSNMSDEDLKLKFKSINGYYKPADDVGVTLINSAIETYVPLSLKNLTVLGGSILKKGFAYFDSLQYVVLKNVSNVGQQAFMNCKSLTKVKIESEETTFGSAVFASCSNMTIYVASQTQKETLEAQGISSLENVECVVASN